eukprot:353952-Chlamydomonas_euryale.AAC.3
MAPCSAMLHRLQTWPGKSIPPLPCPSASLSDMPMWHAWSLPAGNRVADPGARPCRRRRCCRSNSRCCRRCRRRRRCRHDVGCWCHCCYRRDAAGSTIAAAAKAAAAVAAIAAAAKAAAAVAAIAAAAKAAAAVAAIAAAAAVAHGGCRHRHCCRHCCWRYCNHHRCCRHCSRCRHAIPVAAAVLKLAGALTCDPAFDSIPAQGGTGRVRSLSDRGGPDGGPTETVLVVLWKGRSLRIVSASCS